MPRMSTVPPRNQTPGINKRRWILALPALGEDLVHQSPSNRRIIHLPQYVLEDAQPF